MKSRLAIVALALAAVIMSGCSGQPDPVASTPAFTSEEQAFAAAEQTYRNYVDALNHVDLSDPQTFEAVYSWTTGEANAGERKNLSQMNADRWTVTGDTAITDFVGVSASDEVPIEVVAHICTDVSSVKVVDSNGAAVAGPDRPNSYTLEVTFAADTSDPLRLVITSSTAIKANSCEP